MPDGDMRRPPLLWEQQITQRVSVQSVGWGGSSATSPVPGEPAPAPGEPGPEDPVKPPIIGLPSGRPSVPIVERAVAGFTVLWDGNDDAGDPYPDGITVEVHASVLVVYTPDETTLKTTGLAPDVTFNVTGVSVSTSYYVRFIAVDGEGQRSQSSDAAFVLSGSIYPPGDDITSSTPSTPIVERSISGFDVLWDGKDPVGNEFPIGCKAEIHISTIAVYTPGAGTFKSLADPNVLTGISGGLVPSTGYYVSLVVVDPDGERSLQSDTAFVISGSSFPPGDDITASIPSTPVTVQIPSGFTATWDGKDVGAVDFPVGCRAEVHVSTSAVYTPGAGTLKTTVDRGTVATVTDVVNLQAYYVSVVVVDPDGDRSLQSGTSFVVAGSVFPPVTDMATSVPSTPVVAGVTEGLTVSWDGKTNAAAVYGAGVYAQVHVSTTTGFTPGAGTLVTRVDADSTVVVSGLVQGDTYYVKLVAVDGAGTESLASVQATATAGFVTAFDLEDGVIAQKFLAGEVLTTANPEVGARVRISNTGVEVFRDDTNRTFWAKTTGEVLFGSGVSVSPLGVTSIDGGVITTGTINASLVNVTNLNASNINAGAINASVIAVTNLNASNITAGTLSGRVISGNTISGNSISGGTISGTLISGNTISGGTISGTYISSGTAVLNNGTVSGAYISGGTVQGALISAGVFSGGTINAGSVSIQNINAGSINAGTLSGRLIQTSAGNNRIQITTGDTISFWVAGVERTNMIPASLASPLSGYGVLFSGGVDCTQINVSGILATQGASVEFSGLASEAKGAGNSYVLRRNDSNRLRIDSSSQAVKYDITPLDGTLSASVDPARTTDVATVGLADVLGVTVVEFTPVRDEEGSEERIVGFIAEDVAERFPVACERAPDGSPSGVYTTPIVAALLAVVREQQTTIGSLTARIEALEAV